MASIRQIACPCCAVVFERTNKQLNASIKRSGRWVCLRCTTTQRNVQKARPIGSVRVYAKSGYLDEKTEAGWRRQQIVVMERHIGRSISKDEVVHHINENKQDNRLENLALMTIAEHTILHHTGAKRTQQQIKNIADGIRKSARAALSVEIAQWIMESRKAGVLQKEIAAALGVSPMTVSRVVNHQSWR